MIIDKGVVMGVGGAGGGDLLCFGYSVKGPCSILETSCFLGIYPRDLVFIFLSCLTEKLKIVAPTSIVFLILQHHKVVWEHFTDEKMAIQELCV